VRPCLENNQHKTGLVEWLKMWALSSNPSTEKKKKEKKRKIGMFFLRWLKIAYMGWRTFRPFFISGLLLNTTAKSFLKVE
jgi:hypothetical protein